MLANRVRMSMRRGEIEYILATDDDFSGTSNGNFEYIGSHEYVIIPHIIKGVEVTSYIFMFLSSSVIGVVSNNPNITNMSYMFYGSKATTLDLSSFDTSKVTSMDNMFNGSKATTLDLSSFDTSKVTDMDSMFNGSKATTLDLSSFDTSNVNFTGRMFYNSSATTGYARTQADADRFNNSDGKPSALVFVVK